MRRTLLPAVILVSCALMSAQTPEKEGRGWLDTHQAPPAVNVSGVWWGGVDWGRIPLNQREGERSVTGKSSGCDIVGVVSGSDVYLVFSSSGKIDYTASLKAEGSSRLTGAYAYGIPGPKVSTVPMSLAILSGGQKAAPAETGLGVNVDGTWNSPEWGRFKLVQAAGKQDLIGKAQEYDIDGSVNGTTVLLRFTYEGKLQYSAELTSKGNDLLVGRYAGGELGGKSKGKPMRMDRLGPEALDDGPYMQGVYWMQIHSDPPAVNVSGTWDSKEWKTVVLRQKEGGSTVSGTGDHWDVHGHVSGSTLYLLFTYRGNIAYSAVLNMEGEKTLKGAYAGDIMGDETKSRPMLLTRSGPVPSMPARYKATSTQAIEVVNFEAQPAVEFGPDYQTALSDELVRRLIDLKRFAEVTQAGYSTPGAKAPDIRVTGTVVEVNEGIRGVRIGVGMGFGGAYLRARVKFVEVATGKVMLEQDVLGKYSGGEPIYATTELAKEIVKLVKSTGTL